MKKLLSLLLAFCLVLSMAGCTEKTKYERHSTVFFGTFDTVISVIAYTETEEDFEAMSRYIKSEYDRYNKLYDIYNNYPGINNIKTINDAAGKEPVQVSQEIIDLLLFSKEWYEKSGGRMNIRLGSVLKVWHNVRTRREYNRDVRLPRMSLLEEENRHTDIDDIIIDTENMTVYIADPLLRIDVGAVAKGYATEQICSALAENYDSFAISAGGNVRCHGRPLDSDGRTRWGIGIEDPTVDENFMTSGGNIDTAYFNTDMSLVCSGGYQRFFVKDGVRYHHLIDPDTLYPADIYYGVAIICPDSGMADAISTSVFMMRPQEAISFIEGLDNVECILTAIDGTVYKTTGADKYLASSGVSNTTP